MGKENIDCCPLVCEQVNELVQMTKDLLKTADQLKLTKDGLTKKGKELVDLSNLCSNGNDGGSLQLVYEGKDSSRKMPNVGEVSRKVGDMAISVKVKAINGVDAIVRSFPTSVSCHFANGLFVGLFAGYITAHAYSRKKYEKEL